MLRWLMFLFFDVPTLKLSIIILPIDQMTDPKQFSWLPIWPKNNSPSPYFEDICSEKVAVTLCTSFHSTTIFNAQPMESYILPFPFCQAIIKSAYPRPNAVKIKQ